MGLMDRDYMHRTPEERTKSFEDAKKHRERLSEMGKLFAKGEAMTAKDKVRLEQIYEENRAYLSDPSMPSSAQNSENHKSSDGQKQKSTLVPVLIFTIILLLIVLIFTYFPQLANFTLY